MFWRKVVPFWGNFCMGPSGWTNLDISSEPNAPQKTLIILSIHHYSCFKIFRYLMWPYLWRIRFKFGKVSAEFRDTWNSSSWKRIIFYSTLRCTLNHSRTSRMFVFIFWISLNTVKIKWCSLDARADVFHLPVSTGRMINGPKAYEKDNIYSLAAILEF